MNKNKNSKITSSENLSSIKRLLSYVFKKYKLKFFIVITLVLLSSSVGVVSSIFLKILIDNYITPMLSTPNPSFTPLILMISKFAAIYLTGVISTIIYSRMMVTISENILKTIRDELFEHMEKLPIAYFDTHSHGDIMSRYTNDAQAMQQMLTNTLPEFFSSVVTIIAVTIAMLISSPMLSIVVAICMVLLLKVMNSVGGKSSTYFLKQQQSLGLQNGFIEETINGQKIIKVFSREKNIVDDFEKINNELAENTMLANRYSLILIPIVFNIGNLQYAFIAIVGGLFALNNMFGITVGTIAAFLELSRAFSGPMRNISQEMNQLIMSLAGARRIFSLLDEKEENDDGYIELVRVRKNSDGSLIQCEERTGHWAWKDSTNESSSLTELMGDIKFENVSFSYDGKTDVLHNISLYAHPGQKIALVGETGAGKTTITNLINRFYEIQSGSITYDGIDIKKIKKKDLRRSLGMVLQDTHLFTGSINYNLSYGRENVSENEIVEAAKKVQAHNFISLLEDGYNTIISGTDSDLSQGQMQLLSIARAEIYNPPVLILDEATSSIDSRTEMLVQQSMDEVMKGRTTFVIAHRLSTVKNSDVIIVLSKGKIIERGSHDELLALKRTYYKLYTEGFEDKE
ncbi:ABC transporter ATP-binding protein [Peptoniphilus sp. oral taxon 386]|uniref:ABC transporter ATP-binding protein n=1 Tax=Peptoniphilus sp. oral taxon 386 TaxID=652713 RepID=UPI0001DA99AC|nr:ABC transporter ATP-binding protein [Peptoniphilus sp. oral taxon 386]EFI41734.1 ABC transporter, ATP-binding protein [Peptoniphilus sp. oral taxon 386 str. F0131]